MRCYCLCHRQATDYPKGHNMTDLHIFHPTAELLNGWHTPNIEVNDEAGTPVLVVELPFDCQIETSGPFVTPAGYSRYDVEMFDATTGEVDPIETMILRPEADTADVLADRVSSIIEQYV